MPFNIKIKAKVDGQTKTTIHLAGVLGDSYTLCGHDTAGDCTHMEEWGEGIETSLKANCPHCISIVEHCKSLSPRLWEKPKK
jgi:hypothetical protein